MIPAESLRPSVLHARMCLGSLLVTWAKKGLWNSDRLTSTWGELTATPTPQLIQRVSPFLLRSLRNLAIGERGENGIESRVALALSIDSFIGRDWYPGDIRLPEGDPIRVTLPVCGQILTLGRSASSLTWKPGVGVIALEGDVHVTLDQTTIRFLPKFDYEPRAGFTVAATDDCYLVDELARASMMRDMDRTRLEGAGCTIDQALRSIREINSSLAMTIDRDIDCYYLIEGTEDVHKSFTVSTLKGVIFLSLCRSRVRLIEAILHEYCHNQLYWLAELDPLVESCDEKKFYSPWRPDPRPALGLFHAVYVFENVAAFLEYFHQNRSEMNDIDISSRVMLINVQLGIALAQIDKADLTSCGLEIMRVVIESMRRRSAMSALSPNIIRHVQKKASLTTDRHKLQLQAEEIPTLLARATEIVMHGVERMIMSE